VWEKEGGNIMTMRTRPPGQAAIYARVSTERQSLVDKTSLDDQVDNCRETAEELGLTIREDYVIKEAHSASDPDDRPGLERLYRAAAVGEFRYVVMDVIDRTTRAGAFDLASICKRFLDTGVTPVWAGHPDIDLTTAKGQNDAAQLAIDAFHDRERIVDRFQGGKTKRIKRKKLVRSHIDYGYVWDADRPYVGRTDFRENWLPDENGDPSPAVVVRRIFQELADGWRTGGDASSVGVASRLDDEGIPPPSAVKGRPRKATRWGGRPARWQFAMVIYIVQNPSYKGARPQNRWKKVPRTPEERKERIRRAGKPYRSNFKVVELPETEWVMTQVPALVDEETWQDANRQLNRNRKQNHRRPVRYSTVDALLWGGHVRCQICGGAMQVWRATEKRLWMYTCHQTGPKDRHPTKTNRIPVRDIDPFVWSEARRIIRDPEYLRSRLEQTSKQDAWSPEQEVQHYDELIAGCDAREATLYADLDAMRGKPGLERFRDRVLEDVQQNDQGRQGYVKKRDAALAKLKRREEEHGRLQAFQAKAQALSDTLDDLDTEQRRQLLLDLHVTVRVARRDDTRHPRVEVIFCLTTEAAAHLHEGEAWATWNLETPQGTYTTFVEESWPPVNSGDDEGLDFTGITENIGADADDGKGGDDGDGNDPETALDIRETGEYAGGQVDAPATDSPSQHPSKTSRHPEPSRGDCSACHGASGHSLRDRKRPADRRLPPPKMSLRFDSDWWPAPHR
jgi:site-specific DNA recombinase